MIDEKDTLILKALENDGRISFSTLAENVGLSKTPCWQRVKLLQKQGVIQGFGCRIEPTALDLNVRALVHVVVNFDQYQAFEQAILEHPSVHACHAVTGEFDYVLDVLAADIPSFDTLLRTQLSQLPGVERFNTALSTRVVKDNAPYTGMLAT